MNYHILYAYRTEVFYSYGIPASAAISCTRPEDVHSFNRWPHQLPIVHLAYGGTWPISVFYIISGLVLSFKPLHVGNSAIGASPAPLSTLGPPILATFVSMVIIQAGGFEHGRTISSNPTWVPVINEIHYKRLDPLGLQILDWAHKIWRMLHVFWRDLQNQYDVHLWTIPVEFWCSLAIFLIPAYLTVKPQIWKVLLSYLCQ
ncbi:hypothetical protein C7999DRAFT_32013 [Corynascus novoguineensis]|uniref:Uncharacterized protein n=1 Tax=Corynascus novoguineensis TaxID=1126955 RepID=A0AAN7HNR8_9PEZI|nr:hypothetical protein C7999DRAFT_32013 [Corynascus novoguineensis]